VNTDKEFLYKELTGTIIEAALEVHNTLGCGLLEKVYENALARELTLRGIHVATQREYRVTYKEEDIGTYYADMVAEDKVILEIKSVQRIESVHRAQLLNYLRISGLRVGLIFNFAKPRLEHVRLIV
jgi:GxxExxY protein